MGKTILIASGKGGVGKTTLTANLGVALSELGNEVLLLDNDMGLRNLDLALGLENNVFFDVADVISEDCKIREAVIKYDKIDSLSFIAASQFKDELDIDGNKYAAFVNKLKQKYDYVLIDCPAGIGSNITNAAMCSDMALIVVNPDPYSLRDADKLASVFENYSNIKDVRLVINRMRKELINSGVMLNIDSIIEALGIRLAGVVMEDSKVIEASIKGEPVVKLKKSKIAKSFRDIALRVSGVNIPITEIKPKKRFLFF